MLATKSGSRRPFDDHPPRLVPLRSRWITPCRWGCGMGPRSATFPYNGLAMLKCPTCLADVVDGAASCQACGAPLTPDAAETMAPPCGPHRGPVPDWRHCRGALPDSGPVGPRRDGRGLPAEDAKLDQSGRRVPARSSRPQPRRRCRFHNEVRTARQVTHPNVCRVHDIGEADGVALHHDGVRRRRGPRLAAPADRTAARRTRAWRWRTALCAGLAAAHTAGVLHRDLKPANTCSTGPAGSIIMDFGLAAIAAELPRADAGRTPAYMAPEQFQAREADRAERPLRARPRPLRDLHGGAGVQRHSEWRGRGALARWSRASPPPSIASSSRA